MDDELSAEHNFPNRLMSLLEDESVQNVMQWLPCGRMFRISRPDLFDEVVLKPHFNSIKFDSFIVRLRKWGFQRMDRKPNRRYIGSVCTFSAELFRRDKPHLCKQMALKKNKNKRKEKTVPGPYSTPPPAATKCEKEVRNSALSSSAVEMLNPLRTWRDLMMAQAYYYPFRQNNISANTSTKGERGVGAVTNLYHTPQHQQQIISNCYSPSVPDTNYETSYQQLYSSKFKCPNNSQLDNNPTIAARFVASQSYPTENDPRKQFCRMHSEPIFPSNPREKYCIVNQRTEEDYNIDGDEESKLSQPPGPHFSQGSRSYDHLHRAQQHIYRKTICYQQEHPDRSPDRSTNSPKTGEYGKTIPSFAESRVAAAELFQTHENLTNVQQKSTMQHNELNEALDECSLASSVEGLDLHSLASIGSDEYVLS